MTVLNLPLGYAPLSYRLKDGDKVESLANTWLKVLQSRFSIDCGSKDIKVNFQILQHVNPLEAPCEVYFVAEEASYYTLQLASWILMNMPSTWHNTQYVIPFETWCSKLQTMDLWVMTKEGTLVPIEILYPYADTERFFSEVDALWEILINFYCPNFAAVDTSAEALARRLKTQYRWSVWKEAPHVRIIPRMLCGGDTAGSLWRRNQMEYGGLVSYGYASKQHALDDYKALHTEGFLVNV